MPAEAVEEIDAFLRTQALVAGNAPVIAVPLRDLDALPVLAEAIHGLADLLVTGANDLLSSQGRLPYGSRASRGLWQLFRASPE